MLLRRNEIMLSKKSLWFLNPACKLLVTGLALGLVLGACSPSETPEKETGREKTATSSSKLYEPAKVNCSIFTADDAAAILGIPVTGIKADSQELYAGSWLCSYEGGSFEEMVGFSLSTVESVEKAVTDMAQYRSHLETARGVEPFKDDLAKGAYTDISGIGDDALWTAANGTLTVRRGNVSIQVQLPKDREAQVKVAERFLAGLK